MQLDDNHYWYHLMQGETHLVMVQVCMTVQSHRTALT